MSLCQKFIGVFLLISLTYAEDQLKERLKKEMQYLHQQSSKVKVKLPYEVSDWSDTNPSQTKAISDSLSIGQAALQRNTEVQDELELLDLNQFEKQQDPSLRQQNHFKRLKRARPKD